MRPLKIFFKLISFLVFIGLLAILGYLFAIRMGILPEKIPIAGTGSMYPTFPKGIGTESASLSRQIVASPEMKRFPGGILIGNTRFFANRLNRNDIVSFENDKTREIALNDTGNTSGFVKRVIGLPGETVEIRDGFVWIDGIRLIEAFTAVPRSTFGGKFLPDCQKIHIPAGFILVMGDNRKASEDSRNEIGLVAITDIDHVLPYTDQTQYHSLWRDADQDYLLANHPVLDIDEYLHLLNQKRREAGLPALKHQSKLDISAQKRAANMIKYNDLSFDATRSGYTMEKSLAEAGYSNITWGEAPASGYYTAEELIENYFSFRDSRDFLLNKDFQDTGISAQVGEINGCPVQIVVQHLAGYKPPNYKKDVIDSWANALSQLKDILPGWEKAKDYPNLYKGNRETIVEIVDIIKERISRLEAIVSRMRANQWLTDEENIWFDEDEQLSKRLEQIINKLNRS